MEDFIAAAEGLRADLKTGVASFEAWLQQSDTMLLLSLLP